MSAHHHHKHEHADQEAQTYWKSVVQRAAVDQQPARPESAVAKAEREERQEENESRRLGTRLSP
jgi:hypothetical protein